jgi:hypothetical protein
MLLNYNLTNLYTVLINNSVCSTLLIFFLVYFSFVLRNLNIQKEITPKNIKMTPAV